MFPEKEKTKERKKSQIFLQKSPIVHSVTFQNFESSKKLLLHTRGFGVNNLGSSLASGSRTETALL